MEAEKEAVVAMDIGLIIDEIVREVTESTGALIDTRTMIVLVPNVLFFLEQGNTTPLIVHCMVLKSSLLISGGKLTKMEYPLESGLLFTIENV